MSPVIHLVMRHDEPGSPGVPVMAFPDADIAGEHAAAATAATAVEHRTHTVTFAEQQPVRITRHLMTVEVELSGAELWRHEEQLVTFRGHPDDGGESSAEWRVLVRERPSEPPSRVRIELAGPDRAWCIAEARRCWALARESGEFTEAAAIEDMFAISRTE